MSNTTILSGSFVSDGVIREIPLRIEPDWMEVWNYTQWQNSSANAGIKYYWQRGMERAGGLITYSNNGAVLVQPENDRNNDDDLFTLITSTTTPDPWIAGTTLSKADPAVGIIDESPFSTGDLVQLRNCDNMPQLNGQLFTVADYDRLDDVTFFLNTDQAGFSAASTSFEIRRVYNNDAFRASVNNISAITAGSTTQVQLLTCCTGIDVGDSVKLNVPDVWGMTEVDGRIGRVLAYDSSTNTYTVDLDSTGATAFAWPSTSEIPFTYASMAPYGESVAYTGGTRDNSKVRMRLGLGTFTNLPNYGPAGGAGDVMYWRAGKDY